MKKLILNIITYIFKYICNIFKRPSKIIISKNKKSKIHNNQVKNGVLIVKRNDDCDVSENKCK